MVNLELFSQKSFGDKCGIYAIYNTINGKMYIGSSKNTGFRLRRHRETLLNQTHRNSYLQNAFNKYGGLVFEFTLVETCLEIELLEKEQFWLDILCCANDRYGYNIIPRADRQMFSETHRKNLSIAHLGNKHTKKTKAKIAASSSGRVIESTRREVYKVDDNGNIIAIFPSIQIAGDGKRSKAVSIGAACKNIKSVKAYGYFWFYAEDFNMKSFSERKHRKLNAMKKVADKFKNPVTQYSQKFEFVAHFDSIAEAGKLTGINHSQISACSSGKYKTAGGFIWKR